MDRLNNKIRSHQQILTKYVEGIADEYNGSLGNELTYQAITDTKHNHFQLVMLGWTAQRFIYNVLMHFDINLETGNIWIQQNNTERLIAKELQPLGIKKLDLVLGFRPACMRADSDFAVA